MNETKTNRQSVFVKINAWTLILLGITYVIVVYNGLATINKSTNMISDSIKNIMEILTFISSIFLLSLALLLYLETEERNKYLGVLGLIFVAMSTVLTCAVHFIGITVSSILSKSNNELSELLSLDWPSVFLALDILAWDVFFGIGFLLLGIAKLKNDNALAIMCITSGIFSILGLLALPFDNMNIRFIGVFGYTVLPLVVCILIIRRK